MNGNKGRKGGRGEGGKRRGGGGKRKGVVGEEFFHFVVEMGGGGEEKAEKVGTKKVCNALGMKLIRSIREERGGEKGERGFFGSHFGADTRCLPGGRAVYDKGGGGGDRTRGKGVEEGVGGEEGRRGGRESPGLGGGVEEEDGILTKGFHEAIGHFCEVCTNSDL